MSLQQPRASQSLLLLSDPQRCWDHMFLMQILVSTRPARDYVSQECKSEETRDFWCKRMK